MNRLLGLAVVLVVPLALVACGDKTVTMQMTGQNGSFSLVMKGDQTSISTFEDKVSRYIGQAAAQGATLTTVDGDQHTGSRICETDVHDNGFTYHVSLYSDISTLTAGLCTQIAQSTGS